MFSTRLFLAGALIFAGVTSELRSSEPAAPSNEPLIMVVVIDGLRPEYISAALMPRLHALAGAGSIGQRHRSVFPTVTRVNASSIASGSYPSGHGVMHNTVYLPSISSRPLNAGSASTLTRIEQGTGGNLFTAPTLGELLAANGKRLLVAGSSSTGTAFLLNHKVTGDGILNSRQFVKPDQRQARALEVLGAFPEAATPNVARNRWGIDAVIEFGLGESRPDVIILWVNDPDGTAHRHGIGSPETVAALRHVDAEFGRLLDALEKRGLKERANILISTDHGFSTHTGGFDLTRLLIEHELHEDVTVVANQIYVKDGDEEKIRRIVRVLQRTEWAGAIFTRAQESGSARGFVSGTLSFDLIRWNHERSADILVDANWTDAENAFGYRGTTAKPGTAGHGTSSPFDLDIRLIASGPGFKQGLRSPVPTGNVDLAPTILHLLGIEPPAAMHGRVMKELLRDGPAPDTVRVRELVHRASHVNEPGSYEVELRQLAVEDKVYLDFTRVTRGGN